MEVGTPPSSYRKAYATTEVDGVTVHYPLGLIVMGPALELRMGGFWKFKWLKVLGVAPPSPACSF